MSALAVLTALLLALPPITPTDGGYVITHADAAACTRSVLDLRDCREDVAEGLQLAREAEAYERRGREIAEAALATYRETATAPPKGKVPWAVAIGSGVVGFFLGIWATLEVVH